MNTVVRAHGAEPLCPRHGQLRSFERLIVERHGAGAMFILCAFRLHVQAPLRSMSFSRRVAVSFGPAEVLM